MIGVLYVHFWDGAPVTEHVRVTLFLVVSGFLITHILITAKERGGNIVVRNFYIRRSLRLFPALIVCFSVAWAFDADGFRSSAIWHLLSASNIYFAIHENFNPWVVAQLWSLNVLEQFYLIWPLVILYFSSKTLHVFVIICISTLIFVHANANEIGIGGWWLALVLVFDPILTGALAYLLQRQKVVLEVITSHAMITLSIVVLISPFLLWDEFGHSKSYRIFSQAALAIVVVGAFKGYRGPIGWLLQSPPTQFIARISFGVYVYHMLAWYLVGQFYSDIFVKGPLTFFVLSALTIGFATVSWYLIEEPVSRLKKVFPVRSTHSQANVASQLA
jgi:peptidoglycan/LPS O-acetylase OafA/YrhL